MKVSLGGDRLGSGNKNDIELRHYERSTHNLSKDFKSSLSAGVLVPFYCNIALNGDEFDFDLDALGFTIPTKGPLFGSYKLQLDLFACPIRLYQAILHNNPTHIGLNMSSVKLPQILIKSGQLPATEENADNNYNQAKFNESCLLKYLGMSGLGVNGDTSDVNHNAERYIFAGPALAYYDIFKNYYANKQEENAYVITAKDDAEREAADISSVLAMGAHHVTDRWYDQSYVEEKGYEIDLDAIQEHFEEQAAYVEVFGDGLTKENIYLWDGENEDTKFTLKELEQMVYQPSGVQGLVLVSTDTLTKLHITIFGIWFKNFETRTAYLDTNTTYALSSEIAIVDFPLENIDKMRMDILSSNKITDTFVIGSTKVIDMHPVTEGNYYPYKALIDRTSNESGNVTYNVFTQNGLVLKTYQSDLFNNWIQTEWIDGENGIAAITAVDTSEGEFTIDTLNLAQKVYNMLNRIAVSGGTYQDWQEAVYDEKAVRHAETPMYLGGMSTEIIFDQVVSTAATEINGEESAIGTLGGRGRLLEKQEGGKRGGKIHYECNEPSIIMGIVSITPRLTYSQGNKWYLTDIATMDDFHKPALDGIGFQDLLIEQFAWWDTHFFTDDSRPQRQSCGKVPAWINYMTDVDECYGEFAKEDGKAFMVLNRNYGRDKNNDVTDVTTYIDPSKFNYAFAYQELAAQNFWVQIANHITARRKMSAKQIPNL